MPDLVPPCKLQYHLDAPVTAQFSLSVMQVAVTKVLISALIEERAGVRQGLRIARMGGETLGLRIG